jgi:hypothetical protein
VRWRQIIVQFSSDTVLEAETSQEDGKVQFHVRDLRCNDRKCNEQKFMSPGEILRYRHFWFNHRNSKLHEFSKAKCYMLFVFSSACYRLDRCPLSRLNYLNRMRNK